jgi:hypothetical protein
MPIYNLYTRGGAAWTYSGYQLNVAGKNNSTSGPNPLQVQARTYPNTTPPNPGQWTAVSGVSRSGSGNPDNPQNGDSLGLPATIGTLSTSITGNGTYSTTGDGTHGAGYYTTQGPGGDLGDWCATSS